MGTELELKCCFKKKNDFEAKYMYTIYLIDITQFIGQFIT